MRVRAPAMALAAMALAATAPAGARGQGSPVDAAGAPRPDTTGHRSAFVHREGVRLHYLDWGGTGPAVVLLPGYALTAHAFDEVGSLLADAFRVVALTPRGFGESDAPESSEYTLATMVADLRALLDSLGIGRAALVGHSISGSTIAEYARAYPESVTGLVFLDAFPYWAEASGDSIDALSPVNAQGLSGEMTHARVRDFLSRYRFGGWNDALENDLAANALGPELMRRRTLTAGYVRDQRAHPPDLSTVAVPALQLCATSTVRTEYPWLVPGSSEYREAETYVDEVLGPWGRSLCARFAATVPRGRTLAVPGSHYVFFTRPAVTAEAIRGFVRTGG